MRERATILRAAPEPRIKEIPDEEAVELSKSAFHAARREQLALMSGHLNQMLFDPSAVNYRRLRSLRTEAREQVVRAQRVERLLNDATEAFEATRPLA